MEEDFTEGLGGIEITPESIVIDYVNGNPNASLSDISNLINLKYLLFFNTFNLFILRDLS